MNCPKCGHFVRDANQPFCTNCGERIATTFAATSPVSLEVCCPKEITVGDVALAMLRIRGRADLGPDAATEAWLMVQSSCIDRDTPPVKLRISANPFGATTSVRLRPDAAGLVEVKVVVLLDEQRIEQAIFTVEATEKRQRSTSQTIHIGQIGHVVRDEGVGVGEINVNLVTSGLGEDGSSKPALEYLPLALHPLPTGGASSRVEMVRWELCHSIFGRWLCVGKNCRSEKSTSFIVGRELTTDWPVAASDQTRTGQISRQHGRVVVDRAGAHWSPIPTANGSRVNKVPVSVGESQPLTSGDRLSIAEVLDYCVHSDIQVIDDQRRMRYLQYAFHEHCTEFIPDTTRSVRLASSDPNLHLGRTVLMPLCARIGSGTMSELQLPTLRDCHAHVVFLAGRMWIEPAVHGAPVAVNGRALSFGELAPIETSGTVIELGNEHLEVRAVVRDRG